MGTPHMPGKCWCCGSRFHSLQLSTAGEGLTMSGLGRRSYLPQCSRLGIGRKTSTLEASEWRIAGDYRAQENGAIERSAYPDTFFLLNIRLYIFHSIVDPDTATFVSACIEIAGSTSYHEPPTLFLITELVILMSPVWLLVTKKIAEP
jgi:hypothetical protein